MNVSLSSLFPQSLIYGVCISPQQFLSLDNVSLFLHLRNIFLQAVIFPEIQDNEDITSIPTSPYLTQVRSLAESLNEGQKSFLPSPT